MEIVRLSQQEWREYRQLRLEALRTEPQAFQTTYADSLAKPDSFWQGRLKDAASGKGQWLLFSREQGALVGMVGAVTEDDGKRAEIISLYVSPKERGRDFGKALMFAILSEVSKYPGVKTAGLTVNEKRTKAIALYRSLGFSITGKQAVLMGDGQVHSELLMRRTLGTPGAIRTPESGAGSS